MAGNFNPRTFNITPYQQKVEKPWGYELIYSSPDSPTVGKILSVKKDCRWSLQWHDAKTETFCLFSGKANLLIENEQNQLIETPMELHKGYFIHPGQTHRVIALEDSILIETSLPEKGNTVRVEDDYKRSTETEEMRELPNRGWKTNRSW